MLDQTYLILTRQCEIRLELTLDTTMVTLLL
jgi:hypothetical protein